MKIGFCNWKGGVGKTMLSALLTAALKRAGHQVCLDDRDPQKTATEFAPILGLDIGVEAPVVIIDTAPNLENEGTRSAICEADLLVVVVTPDPFVLRSTKRTAQLIQEIRSPEKPVRMLVNMVHSHTRLEKWVGEMHSDFPFPFFKEMLPHRQNYKLASFQGWEALDASARDSLLQVALAVLGAVPK